MRRRLSLFLSFLPPATLLAATVSAHDFWLEPSSYKPAAAQPLSLRLKVGELFLGDPVPYDGTLLQRFEVLTARSTLPLIGRDGMDPAGRTLLRGEEAEVVVVYESRASTTEMTPELFALYLEQEGLSAIAAERRERGILPGSQGARDAFSRHAKTLLRGPAPGGAAGAFVARQGLELELRPLAPPALGDGWAVELLFRGRPLADTQVVAIPRRRPQDAQVRRTDAQGRVALALAADEWLVKAVHVVPAADFERSAIKDGLGAEYRSFWASLTFSLR